MDFVISSSEDSHISRVSQSPQPSSYTTSTRISSGPAKRYARVHVLLMSWEKDDIGVETEIMDLERVLQDLYHFDTERYLIPSVDSETQLDDRLVGWRQSCDSKGENLLILYYGGNGRVEMSFGVPGQNRWIANHEPDSPSLTWSDIQGNLQRRCKSDLLFIGDCCGAATASFGAGTKEGLWACGPTGSAPVGKYSFTNNLIEELKTLSGTRYNVVMLHSRLSQRFLHPVHKGELLAEPWYTFMGKEMAPSIELMPQAAQDLLTKAEQPATQLLTETNPQSKDITSKELKGSNNDTTTTWAQQSYQHKIVYKRIVDFGVLGALSFTDHLLKWTTELGYQLASACILFSEEYKQSVPVAEEQGNQLLNQLILSLRAAGIQEPSKEMLETPIKLTTDINQQVLRVHGSNACALVLMAELARAMSYFHHNKKALADIINGHASDIHGYCPDLDIDIPRFAQMLQNHDLAQLSATQLYRMITDMAKPLSILMLSADCRNEKRLRIGEERREMEEVIRNGRLSNSLILKEIPSCRARDITRALDLHRPDILHFSGHGNNSSVVFENNFGLAQPIDKIALANLLASQKQLGLVVLNACYSYDMAQAIADAVGYVIGMDGSILDEDCVSFAREFYQALVHGRTLQAAFEQAKLAIALTSSMKVYLNQRQIPGNK